MSSLLLLDVYVCGSFCYGSLCFFGFFTSTAAQKLLDSFPSNKAMAYLRSQTWTVDISKNIIILLNEPP